MAKTLVEATNLRKRYGKKAVVKGVSFAVEQHEIFGIVGPNGAGKTTTLEMIEAMRPIDGGRASIDGLDVQQNPRKIRGLIGVQPQSAAFFDKTKLKELLEYFGALYGKKVHPRRLLQGVHLTEKENSYFEHLSGGQKQRFSIAAALVHSPKVLFLDEPTTGLDPQARRNLWELIKIIRKDGITIILTTHYMEEAELLCDRVAIMDKGKIIALDTPQNLIKNLLDKGFKKERRVEQANLEDVFIDLTGKELRE
jgi:ABC-2 type transport system ATP-binding protein